MGHKKANATAFLKEKEENKMEKIKITLKQKMINSMIDDIIKKYGFENKKTIRFCQITEESNNIKLIRKIYQRLMEF